MLKIQHISLSDTRDDIPSALAFRKDSKEILFGAEALTASPLEYDIVINWKLLLGKSQSELKQETIVNESLSRVLDRHSPEDIAALYFEKIVQKLKIETSAGDKPHVIIGIPATVDTTSDWRSRYKKTVERAFQRNSFPVPKFFPEPFAVFQYHWNQQDFPDAGRHQNIFVVDIGGGTTNVCFIQTTAHGRLARGGANHIPHGVGSIEVGGSNIDKFILDHFLPARLANYSGQALVSASRAKERLAIRIDKQELWNDATALAKMGEEVEATSSRRHTLTGGDLKSIIVGKVWPAINATLRESLAAVRGARLAHPVESIDAVILAGGTCQMGLIELLFRADVASDEMFEKSRFVRSIGYANAVSEGLAIEAHANSRLHDIRPTRVAPYLQDHIRLQASHRKDGLEIPRKLKGRAREVEGDTKEGILLRSPQGILPLVNKKLYWTFSLAQKPREVFLNIEKLEPSTKEVALDFIRPIERIKLAKRSDDYSSDMRLALIVRSDGFAEISVEVSSQSDGAVIYPAGEIDLHDLSKMEGTLFYGIDFGTSSTSSSFVNLKDSSILSALPEEYRAEEPVLRRAEALAEKAYQLLRERANAKKFLAQVNNEIVSDYVYHSNRIEGSLLSRGQTAKILDTISEERTLSGNATLNRIVEKMSYVDDTGEVKTVSRPVKDGIAAVNLRDAFKLIMDSANDDNFHFSAFYLKELQGLVNRGDSSAKPGVFRNGPVRIEQTSFVPPDAIHVPGLVDEMFEDFLSERFKALTPIIQATEAHARFVSIHPFSDGNGRVARLLANFFLWRAALPGVLLTWENRDRYYDALEECNTKELTNRGNLSDLGMLFCDLFEDMAFNLSEILNSAAVPEEPVVTRKISAGNRVADLLARLGKQKIALDYHEQYKKWVASQENILAGVGQAANDLSQGFNTAWGGKIEVVHFPLIDEDTYRAIRSKQRFSRTWYFRSKFYLPNSVEDFVFFFGPNSIIARNLDESLSLTVSLHIARFDLASARHIPLREESWSRVKEMVHDGSSLGVLIEETNQPRIERGDETKVENWFGMLAEDVVARLAKLDLENVSV